MALTEPPLLTGTDGLADPGQAVPPAPPVLRRRRAILGSRRRQIGAAALIATAVAFLLVEGLGNATEYYKTVPQAIAARAKLGTTQFRIMGTVGPSVRQVGHQTEFTISYNQASTQVVDSREPPELFKPGIPVVLEGHWSGAFFQSDLIMVKHTAIYNPAEKAVFSTIPGAQSPAPSSPAPSSPAPSSPAGPSSPASSQ